MSLGVMGRKCGMTRQFNDDGTVHAVTVVELYDNQRVTQLKTNDSDGYDAIQVSFGIKKVNGMTKPAKGHYGKAGVPFAHGLYELRGAHDASLGDVISLDWLSNCDFVDVSSTSKGKGFAGTIKRHHFSSQDATHGNSKATRKPGSTGQNQTPGRVFKGKKMAGQLGNRQVTMQSLRKVKYDAEKRLLLIKGSLPGPVGARVFIRPAIKEKSHA